MIVHGLLRRCMRARCSSKEPGANESRKEMIRTRTRPRRRRMRREEAEAVRMRERKKISSQKKARVHKKRVCKKSKKKKKPKEAAVHELQRRSRAGGSFSCCRVAGSTVQGRQARETECIRRKRERKRRRRSESSRRRSRDDPLRGAHARHCSDQNRRSIVVSWFRIESISWLARFSPVESSSLSSSSSSFPKNSSHRSRSLLVSISHSTVTKTTRNGFHDTLKLSYRHTRNGSHKSTDGKECEKPK